MTVALTLTNYPASSENDAAIISCPKELRGRVVVTDVDTLGVTARLIEDHILIYRYPLHGWIFRTNAARRYDVRATCAPDIKWRVVMTFYPMSVNFNAGETPIFFGRIVDSLTETPLTTSDVSAVSLTIYAYSRNNIRTTQGTGYVPIKDWENISLTVADVIDDNPQTDPRAGFAPNLVYEPDTLTDNPFSNPGQYRAVFTITPTQGNNIPVVVDFTTK